MLLQFGWERNCRSHLVLVSCSSSKAYPDYIIISSDNHFSTLHSWTASDKHTIVNLDHSGWVQKNPAQATAPSSSLLLSELSSKRLMWDSWHSRTPTLSLPIPVLHSHTYWHYTLVIDINGECWNFNSFFHFSSPRMLTAIWPWPLRLTSSEAPFFALRSVCVEGVCGE